MAVAIRPVFTSISCYPFFTKTDVQFVWFSGTTVQQKQRSIASLHGLFLKATPNKKVLEISTKGTVPLGNELSAFNLKYQLNGQDIYLECIFQGGKVFQNGGPYTELYQVHPKEAKNDPRIKNGTNVIKFSLDGQTFPNVPDDYFYSWIYSKALYDDKALLEKVRKMDYDSFTDIEFNPKKSINCQAKALAVFKGLDMAGLLGAAMLSPDDYLYIVYKNGSAGPGKTIRESS